MEYSVSPVGEKFKLPDEEAYRKEYARLEKLVRAQRKEGREIVVVMGLANVAGAIIGDALGYAAVFAGSFLLSAAGCLFLVARGTGLEGRTNLTLRTVELTNQTPKLQTLAEQIRGFELSADGKKLLWRAGKERGITDARAGLSPGAGRLSEILVKEGETVEVRTAVAIIVKD